MLGEWQKRSFKRREMEYELRHEVKDPRPTKRKFFTTLKPTHHAKVPFEKRDDFKNFMPPILRKWNGDHKYWEVDLTNFSPSLLTRLQELGVSFTPIT